MTRLSFGLLLRIFLAGLLLGSASAWSQETDEAVLLAQAKMTEMRTMAIRQMDGDFWKEGKFTPEQEKLFIATRLAAEDRVREMVHQTPGAIFRPSLMAVELDAALAKAFGLEEAKRYREWNNTRLGWSMVWHNPILKAEDWLTFEE